MSSLKIGNWYNRTGTSSVEFKKKLIMHVKQHSSVWRKNFMAKQAAWKTIEQEMGFPCSLKELQASWASLRTVYFRKIFIRTIERNFEAPNWIYFHDMTFLYDIVKEKIQKKLGGISPPLFKARPYSNGSPNFRCPCCIYVGSDLNLAPDMSSANIEFKQQDEFQSTTTSETSFENYQGAIDNSMGSDFDSQSVHSICSLDAKHSENQSSTTNSPVPQQSEPENSLPRESSSDLVKTKNFGVIDLIDDTETSDEYPDSQPQPRSFKNVTDNYSFEIISQPLAEKEIRSIGLNNSLEPQSPRLNELIHSFAISDCSEDSTLKEPESRSKEQTQSPGHSKTTNNAVPMLSAKSNNSNSNRQFEMSAYQLRDLERLKIIEAVKANPAAYTNPKKKGHEFNVAWHRVAKEVGNASLPTIKNRWRLLKQRYLKELVCERYRNGMERSMWEYFEEMEFLRPYMQKDIEEIHKTRIQIRDTIKKNAEESNNRSNSTPEFSEPVLRDETNEISSIRNIAKSTNNQPQFFNSDKGIVVYVNANQTIKIANVETVKPVTPIEAFSSKPEHIEQPIVFDENKLPILQNRPVKITAVQVPPSLDLESKNNAKPLPLVKTYRKRISYKKTETNLHANEIPKILPSPLVLDLTNDEDKAEPKDNAEPPPPQKKSRKSTGSEKNETNVHANETPKRLGCSPASSLTQDLSTDDATKVSAPTVQFQQLQPQKVFPPLDLTLDDNPLVIVPIPASKTNPISKFQQVFMNELVNTNKVFPTFDLTTDEDKDQGKNPCDNNEILSKSKNGVDKDDKNVICLDDDDSVGSYEEVVVYFAQENKN